MAYAQQPIRAARPRRRRHVGAGLLTAPLMLFGAATLIAVAYVGYVLWPRWPEAPVTLDAPSLPIVVAGTAFNIEPAAIRMAVQRHAGTQDRVDLAYLWPSLKPPDPLFEPKVGTPVNPNERLFVTVASGDGTLPLIERVQTIYPRYLAPEPTAGPAGLTLRAFRAGTPYQGEELVFESAEPTHFLARCSRHGVTNSGTCLLERRVGEADITLRFPRDWLRDWKNLAAGIDRLLARLQAETK
jgi:hypothetical protein